MFESTTHFDFDDDILDTSFTPPIKSTQIIQEHTRDDEEFDNKNTKKLRIDERVVNTLSTSKAIPKHTFASPNRVVKRKFPGPAGLLPEIGHSNKSIVELLENEKFESDTVDDIPILSQQSNLVFENGPWSEMTRDLFEKNGKNLIERFNIKWIKKQALKHLLNYKAPFLAALIENIKIIDSKIPTINVILKDSTGDIRGTILHTLYEEYTNYFRIGSVIVLKHFGVLSTSYNSHCLTITPNNLISIYCPKTSTKLSFGEPENVSEGTSEKDTIRKIIIQDCCVDEILNKYNKDILAYSEQERTKIDFKKLHRSNSSEPGTSCSSRSRIVPNRTELRVNEHENITSFKSGDSMTPDLKQTLQSNSGIPPNTLSLITNRNTVSSSRETSSVSLPSAVPHLSSTKKKFSFKKLDNSKTGTSENIKSVDNKNINKDIRTCDNVAVTSNKISVTPESKEHADIWKNLLEDVDTDSLFDDF